MKIDIIFDGLAIGNRKSVQGLSALLSGNNDLRSFSLTESQTKLTFIHFLRAGILLATLIVVPAMAVCWNMIPKDFWENDQYDKNDQTTWISSASEQSEQPENSRSGEELTVESVVELPATSPPFLLSRPQEDVRGQNTAIKTMGGTNDKTSEQPIPNSFNNKSSITLAAEPSEQIQKENYFAEQQTTEILPQRNFPILESQLKQLGAKYYRLEKWGSRGELFRFSCYVSPSDSYQYQKYFQAIDSDELRVMESVIEEIKRWKKTDRTGL
ncbi:MAG: hypothetical protein LBK82_08575 [Planctomycetaceae bacterium]|nr:hypothetical protein [Planctomycetaceae bacterium]